jgi:hypothetical protein
MSAPCWIDAAAICSRLTTRGLARAVITRGAAKADIATSERQVDLTVASRSWGWSNLWSYRRRTGGPNSYAKSSSFLKGKAHYMVASATNSFRLFNSESL